MNQTPKRDNAHGQVGEIGTAKRNQRSNSNTLWQRYEYLKGEIYERATSAKEYSEAVQRLAAAMGI